MTHDDTQAPKRYTHADIRMAGSLPDGFSFLTASIPKDGATIDEIISTANHTTKVKLVVDAVDGEGRLRDHKEIIIEMVSRFRRVEPNVEENE